MWEQIDSYKKVLELGLDGAESPSTWPWSFYPRDELLDVTNRWPSDCGTALTAFARRVDCDDLACFEAGTRSVVLIEGWTAGGKGFQYVKSYPDFAAWALEAASDTDG